MPSRKIALVAALALAPPLLLTGLAVSAQAQPGCTHTLATGTSAVTGGTQINFSVTCQGQPRTVSIQHEGTLDGTTVFLASSSAFVGSDDKQGLTEAIHLPPIPVGRFCTTIDAGDGPQEVCVPPK